MGSSTRKKRLRPIGFGETVGDVVGDVEALLFTLHQSVAEVDVKPLVSGVTLTEMVAKKKGQQILLHTR